MSRGFVKEGDQEETPLVPPRAFLPPGADNYVTANGLTELKDEQRQLKEEQKALIQESNEINRVQINFLTSKLHLLEERINSARVVDLSSQPQNTIHFGAIVTLYKTNEKCHSHYQLVGVDEANVSLNKVSFVSPLAKILLGKKVGDSILLKTPSGDRVMEIELIEYT